MILKALAFQSKGDWDEALSTLEQALILAEPGGFIRTLLDEGPPVTTLLAKLKLKNNRLKEYVHALIAAQDETEIQPSIASSQASVEPLSKREVEVLQHIAEGFTNREIAERLYLTLNTVKVHNRNIYRKLGVNNRIQAISRARDLGILPSS